MPKRGSFNIPHTIVDELISHWDEEKGRLQSIIKMRVNAAPQIVYATARAKRGLVRMITLKPGNAKTKTMGIHRRVSKEYGKHGGKYYIRTVSDPKAKFGVPVRTGGLRASIMKEVVGEKHIIKGRVWTDSPYANFLEFGTWKMAARPFMRPALYENAEEIKRIFRADA